jgi:anti-anti-sigma regulatory factor
MSTQAECERRSERRLILEGKLLAPWVTELRTACEKARGDLQNRELVIDLKNVTAISSEGENVLLELG